MMNNLGIIYLFNPDTQRAGILDDIPATVYNRATL